MDVTVPAVPFSVWIWAGLDPVLIGVALWLGWQATQAGKVFIAAIAALGAALLVDALLTRLGIPWIAPLSRDGPMLIPVRSGAALVWATVGYAAAKMLRPKSRAGARPSDAARP